MPSIDNTYVVRLKPYDLGWVITDTQIHVI